MSRKGFSVAVLVLATLVLGGPAPLAQGASEEELAALRAELQRAVSLLKAQEQVIGTLQERLAALERAQAAPAPAPPQAPQAQSAAPQKAPAVSWKEGKTTFRLEGAELSLSNSLQVRGTYTDAGSDARTDGRAFRVRRMETKLAGWAFTPQLEFELELDWAKEKPLKSAFARYDFTGGKKHFMVTGGQFKAPFGRQELDSSGRLMFVDRSTVSGLFARGEDVGVMASGQFGTEETPDLVAWAAGVFNGNGVYDGKNADGHFMYDARLVVSPWGNAGKEEVRPMGAERPLLSVGAGVEVNDTRVYTSGGAPGSGEEYTAWGADFAFHYGRFSLLGEHFDREATTVAWVDRRDTGTVGEAGWLFVPGRFQVGLRWGQTRQRWPASVEGQRERGLVANLFFHKHAHKLVTDLLWLDDRGTGVQEKQVRVQYQLWF